MKLGSKNNLAQQDKSPILFFKLTPPYCISISTWMSSMNTTPGSVVPVVHVEISFNVLVEVFGERLILKYSFQQQIFPEMSTLFLSRAWHLQSFPKNYYKCLLLRKPMKIFRFVMHRQKVFIMYLNNVNLSIFKI